jgi:hypothetical protein
MSIHKLVSMVGFLSLAAFAQNCQQGSIEWQVSQQCACIKDPGSDACKLYKSNKSLFDGTAGLKTPAADRIRQTVAPQQRTPATTLLPADTPFWQMLPAGTRMAVGMRPQWLSNSPLLDQVLSLGGQLGGKSMDSVRRELAGVDVVIMAFTRLGGAPLILARADDVVRATKAERDPYRYVDANTILVGAPNETSAAMRRLLSQDAASAEARMAGRVAAWSDVWLVLDPSAVPGKSAQLPGVTKMTVGLAMREGLTMEAWLDTPSAFAAKNLAAWLQKNPQGSPLYGQLSATPIVELRENSVRLYARVAASQFTGSASPTAAQAAPAASTVKRSQVADVTTGMDRAAVEAVLGKPNSVMGIQGSDEAIETLIYNLDDKATARVRTVNGKVVSVQVLD